MERVKKLRKEVGIKQKDMAEALGINHPNYANLENGRYIPNGIKEIEKEAISILKPLLMVKILSTDKELDRLKSLMIQYQN